MKYGSVYTPPSLALFTAKLLRYVADCDGKTEFYQILDPACGELSLLEAASDILSHKKMSGVDVDCNAIEQSRAAASDINLEVRLINADFVLPSKRLSSATYWKRRLGPVDAILANPPWSSDRIYARDDLLNHGIELIHGQYDAYSLFIELGVKMLASDGYAAFILPDSIFSSTGLDLRRFLLENTRLRVIARLGEKLFPGIHRSTVIIVLQKGAPDSSSLTECYRLSTEKRREFLCGTVDLFDSFMCDKHSRLQLHFLNNCGVEFDVDTRQEDIETLDAISRMGSNWTSELSFYRGIEISKSGKVCLCPACGKASSISNKNLRELTKTCPHCGQEFPIEVSDFIHLISDNRAEGWKTLLVGENIARYMIRGEKYVAPSIDGINYKDASIYRGPKLLVRKTGIGIKSVVSTKSELTTQTIYFFKPFFQEFDDLGMLYFYAALLNSRTIYYYYLKRYGENEWKSHPYLTKTIIESLPLIGYDPSNELHVGISLRSRSLCEKYDKSVDLELEGMIQDLYGLNNACRELIRATMNDLPGLSVIEEMKY